MSNTNNSISKIIKNTNLNSFSAALLKTSEQLKKSKKAADLTLSKVYLESFAKVAKVSYKNLKKDAEESGIKIVDTNPIEGFKIGTKMNQEQYNLFVIRNLDDSLSDEERSFAKEALMSDYMNRVYLSVASSRLHCESGSYDQDDLKSTAYEAYFKSINSPSILTALIQGHELINRGILRGTCGILDTFTKSNRLQDQMGQSFRERKTIVMLEQAKNAQMPVDYDAIAKKAQLKVETVKEIDKTQAQIATQESYDCAVSDGAASNENVVTRLDLIESSENVSGSVEETETFKEVKKLVDNYLDEDQKKIWLMKNGFYDGETYTVSAICRELGLTRREVNVKLEKAMDILQKGCLLKGIFEGNYTEKEEPEKKTKKKTEIVEVKENEEEIPAVSETTSESASNEEIAEVFNVFEGTFSEVIVGQEEEQSDICEYISDLVDDFLDEDQKKIWLMKNGFYDGKPYSIPSIYKHLKMSKEEVATKLQSAVDVLKAAQVFKRTFANTGQKSHLFCCTA